MVCPGSPPVTRQRSFVALFATLLSLAPLALNAAAEVRPGTILVAGFLPIGNPVVALRGALFAVDPLSGRRELLSDFLDDRQGPRGVAPTDVVVTPGGRILVLDAEAGAFGSFGAIFAVNPQTGQRTLLSDLSDPAQGPIAASPEGLAVSPSGSVFVVDQGGGMNGVVLAVDPFDGRRRVLSNFGDAAQGGAFGRQPFAVGVLDDAMPASTSVQRRAAP